MDNWGGSHNGRVGQRFFNWDGSERIPKGQVEVYGSRGCLMADCPGLRGKPPGVVGKVGLRVGRR